MAVYIKQSPPREGVRGGWEDFNWDSVKTQSTGDRDYYLGASAKVGIYSRGKFEKFDWWTKKKEGGPDGAEDEELRRVKRFEQQLLEEALGRRPRQLLAGEGLADQEPPPPVEAPDANNRNAAKALKKLKKEQKRLKKVKKKEQKRATRRLRMMKQERRSDSRSSREPTPAKSSSSSRSGSSARRHRHSRQNRRRSRSSSRSPQRDDLYHLSVHAKRSSSKEIRTLGRRGRAHGSAKREELRGHEHREIDTRKRRQTRSLEQGRHKQSRRSSPLRREHKRDRADHRRSRSPRKGHHHGKSHSKERQTGHRSRYSEEASNRRRLEAVKAEEHRSRRRDIPDAGQRSRDHRPPNCYSRERRDAEEPRAIYEGERAQESKGHHRTHGETRDSKGDSDLLRVNREL